MPEFPEGLGVTRRQFLKVTAGGIAGTALFALGAAEVGPLLAGSSTPQDLPRNLMRSSFAGHLGENFKFHIGPLETVDAELIQVSGIASSPTHSADENFSVVFRGPHDRPLEQDTYLVEHQAVGAFPLFIVPIYSEGGGLNYEAVFNRLQS